MKHFILLINIVFVSCSTANQDFSAKKEKVEINNLLNAWHKSAAEGDENIFFSIFLNSDDVYIGTDPTELWTLKEFKSWSKPYFDKDKGWEFKTKERNIYFDNNNPNYAWFDELLDTWMGVCRSSGVLTKVNGQWKLRHYHLSVAMPNDLIEKYLELLPNK